MTYFDLKTYINYIYDTVELNQTKTNKICRFVKPTKEFLEENAIKTVINCRIDYNDEEIIPKECEEIFFNVSSWHKGGGGFDEDEEEDESEDEENVGGGEINEKSIILFQNKELDKLIDIIKDKLILGNVLIHCLIGAHRSAFVLGCFLLKYDNKNGLNYKYKNIYKFMINKRNIVSELSFGKYMIAYKQYLEKENV